MKKAIVVRGTLAEPRRIELDEPVTQLQGRVEVVLQAEASQVTGARDVFDVIAALPGGPRSKDVIDGQIGEERESWSGR